MIVALHLSEPPSANRYWRHVGPRVLLSREAKAYRLAVRAEYVRTLGTLRVAFPDGPLAVALTWHRSRKSGDLDNRIKITLDSLRGTAYMDDAQIVRINAERKESPRNGYLLVTVTREAVA